MTPYVSVIKHPHGHSCEHGHPCELGCSASQPHDCVRCFRDAIDAAGLPDLTAEEIATEIRLHRRERRT